MVGILSPLQSLCLCLLSIGVCGLELWVLGDKGHCVFASDLEERLSSLLEPVLELSRDLSVSDLVGHPPEVICHQVEVGASIAADKNNACVVCMLGERLGRTRVAHIAGKHHHQLALQIRRRQRPQRRRNRTSERIHHSRGGYHSRGGEGGGGGGRGGGEGGGEGGEESGEEGGEGWNEASQHWEVEEKERSDVVIDVMTMTVMVMVMVMLCV